MGRILPIELPIELPIVLACQQANRPRTPCGTSAQECSSGIFHMPPVPENCIQLPIELPIELPIADEIAY